MKRLLTAVSRFFTHSFLWLGIGSVLWLLLRSGTKPSRLRYPCQQAAAGTGSLPRRTPPVPVRASLPVWVSGLPNQSHIFVVDSVPVPDSNAVYHEGLDSLLSLLARNGTCLYRSSKHLPWCDTAGMIAKNDVVLIKVNAEWPERGMPSTDLLKGLIARIVAHPDTFTGEVELVENGQWRQSWAYPLNNAERHSQTMQSVVDLFAGQGYNVGAYNWTAIGYQGNNRWVSEFDQDDTVSGYVREDSTGMTYAKFVTSFGTSISTRLGVWNGSAYEPARLKFINMPVLKSHSFAGVSASVKHYIGFLSYQAIGPSTMHSRAMTEGLLGVDFGKARFPDLNIIDATWVSAEITTGPEAPYDKCTRLNTLVASKDPIAADWYAGKYVLRPASWWSGHPSLHDYGRMDPDNLNTENPGSGRPYSDSTPCNGYPYNAFHQMLASSRDQMLRYGRQVTMDTSQMTVHLFHFPHVALEEPHPAVPATGRIEVTPNPATGRITVSYQLAAAGPVRLLVFTEDGRMVAALPQGVLPAGEHTLTLDRTLSPGTYLLTLETGAGRESQKVVIPGR
jgi:hypothetical protein